jgi:hypothetical protein
MIEGVKATSKHKQTPASKHAAVSMFRGHVAAVPKRRHETTIEFR